MDDMMIDLMAGDAELRKRLMAFADARLTPELGASTRMRAKVLAVAHRQADLARADAALAVLRPFTGVLAEEDGVTPARLREGRRARRRRVATILLAATMALGVGAGSAFAARPGGPLYTARVWIETLTLPSSGRARAVAELERLEARLGEAMTANAAGDDAATNAALDAYAAILDEASTSAAVLADEVASAVLQVGVTHNLEVLQALSGRLPDAAAAGIQRAIDNAIAHSGQALDTIHAGNGADGGTNGGGNGGGGAGGQNGDPSGGNGVGVPAEPTHSPKPEPTVKPTKQAPETHPTPEATPAPTARPTHTPRPDRTPPAGDKKTPAPQATPGHTPRGNG